MRINTQDETLKRNYLQKYRFLIKEYEFVEEGQDPRFRLVKDFCKALQEHIICSRSNT